ncbi:GMC oxidoreductase [Peristeroidobacter agariperforans]|uniref:GMC oxidoreductase n=1 Tax=Peristeroidobacter agariperforans TaxID=268404 RepID=UPI00101C9D9F|nr:GMC oxidoreductase [Peristeroidobacter agariperforans]
MYYVIGSGPAGIAAAAALISAGSEVTLLDVGIELDEEREVRRQRMATRDASEWTEEEISSSRAHLEINGELEAKLCHGSDHAYKPAPSATRIDYGSLAVRSSAAKGGLSNVWGAALLPFHQNDTLDWPITMSDLSDSYRAVLQLIPVAGMQDDLRRLFPLYTERLHRPRISAQAESLLADLTRNRAELSRCGVTFGSARLAVRFSGASPSDSCNFCGHCMHGCPRDLIYSSRHTLSELLASGKLKYVPKVVAQMISEQGSRVTVMASVNGCPVQFSGERVFIGAGVFNSTAILLRSLGWHDRPVQISDSQYFVFPLLRVRASSHVDKERLHTLAQVFLEILAPAISPYLVHLQIYGFNDLLADLVKLRLKALWKFFPRDALLGRLLVVQGFLHSGHSGHITATLRRSAEGSVLRLEPVESSDARDRVGRVIQHMRRLSKSTRAVPLASALRIMQPGRSFHCGGSFPMSRSPHDGQTDILGRPFGLNRTHVIDATVFPSIPATTITQTVMANAYRIASQSVGLDQFHQV